MSKIKNKQQTLTQRILTLEKIVTTLYFKDKAREEKENETE